MSPEREGREGKRKEGREGIGGKGRGGVGRGGENRDGGTENRREWKGKRGLAGERAHQIKMLDI